MINTTRISVTVVALAVVLSMLPTVYADIPLAGTVQGKDGDDAVEAGMADVRVYRNGTVVVSGSTEPGGAYDLVVPGDAPIDRVTFVTRNTEWHPWVVRSVSANSGNIRLPVLLMPDNGPTSFDLSLQQYMTYEELYYLTLGEDESGQMVNRLIATSQPRLFGMPEVSELEDLSRLQRQILEERRAAILRLYRMSTSLRNSTWDTEYRATNGRRYRSVVKLQGNRGTYDVFDNGNVIATGQLSNVEIARDGAAFSISGNWELGNSRGYFTWFNRPGDPMAFDGEWGFDLNQGKVDYWKGRLR